MKFQLNFTVLAYVLSNAQISLIGKIGKLVVTFAFLNLEWF